MMRAFLAGFAFVVPVAVAAQPTAVIVGATVIDGTGRPPLSDAAIVVANGRVVSVGSAATTKVPAGAAVIAARGKYVIPGMMDANVHLVYGVSIEFLARYEGRFDEIVAEATQVALANGLTTVFDSWGPLGPLLRTRDRIAKGDIPGARLFVAGNILGLTGPFGRDFNGDAERTASKPFVDRIDAAWEEGTGPELMWLTPDSLRVAIRAYTATKMDFLKYAVSGHTSMEMLMFSPEQQRVIVEEGHRAGITVQTHTTSVESLRQAIEAGVDLMQHCSITGRVAIPDTTMALLKSGRVFCAVQPLTKARIEVAAGPIAAGYPKRVYFAELTRVQDENDRRMIAAKIPVLLATDAGIMNPDEHDALSEAMKKDESTDLGRAHFLWFKAMAEKGLKPMDAILAATANIAKAYHLDRDLGTLEPGKRADLVILDGDPLADIMNVERTAMVMKDGVVVNRASLPVKRVLTKP